LEITTTKSVILIAKITQKNREILEGLANYISVGGIVNGPPGGLILNQKIKEFTNVSNY